MKRIRIFILFCCLVGISNGQTFNYNFNAVAGSFVANTTGSVSIHAAGVDDALSAAITLPFTFVYNCTNYTGIKVSSNGVLFLGTAAVGTNATNNLNTSTDRPAIAPLWDDLATMTTSGKVSYQVTGVSPNRVFTVEWLNMKWSWSGTAAAISFQAKLYETTNVIEFVYRQEAGAIVVNGASIGISGPTSGKYYSLPNSGTAPVPSTVLETTSISTKPATGQIYRWTPNPIVPAVTANSQTICSGSATLQATGGVGTYSWSTGATTSSIVVTPASTTNYTVYSGTAPCAVQNTLAVTVNPAPVAPTLSQVSSTLCGSTNATLTASGSSGNYLWYQSVGGYAVGTAPSYAINSLTSTTTYYGAASTTTAIPYTSLTYTYSGGLQTLTIPTGVTSVTVTAWGAKGGNGNATYPGANGASVNGVLSVTPGQVLNIYVGGVGSVPAGGYNGGGAGGISSAGTGAGGGGASDIRIGGTALANRVLVAGGGGGSGFSTTYAPSGGSGGGGTANTSPLGVGGGGAGGCAIGSGGALAGGTAPTYGSGGGGGGMTSGGGGGGLPSAATGGYGCNGTLGTGGAGGGTSFICGGATGGVNGGGGGGGGYYGGGGGMTGTGGCNGGGGGGSSYADNTIASAVVFAAGVSAGNGSVTISYGGGSVCRSALVPIIVNVTPQGPTLSVMSQTICSGSSATLNVSGGTTYTWSTGSNANSVIVSPTSNTTYSVNSGSLPCVTQNTVSVSVNAIPTTPVITPSVINLCGSGTATLNASGSSGNYSWYNSSLTSVGSGNNYTTPTLTTNATYYVASSTTSLIAAGSQTFNYSGSIQTWTVPASVTSLTIEARGAQGGYNTGGTGGNGAIMSGEFAVTPGQVFSILVGQSPGSVTTGGYTYPGGGGGSFVALGASYSTATPLIVAGGGGGGYSTVGDQAPVTTSGTGLTPGTGGNGAPSNSCGGGGGGFYTSGGNDLLYAFIGGKGFQQGGAGGTAAAAYTGYQPGGFGGGATANWVGSCNLQAGAGGGYSGGSAYSTTSYAIGSAGGSFNSGTNQVNTGGANTGNGVVIISWNINTPCNTAFVPVNIIVNPTPTLSVVSTDTYLCTNTISAVLSVTGANNYTWQPGNTTGNTLTVSPSSTTTYSVIGTNSNGCSDNQFITITVCNILPIELLNFDANKYNNSTVRLDWSTTSEKNSSKFIIEKTIDGNNWTFVAKTDAAGNSNSLRSYSAFDYNLSSGIYYYRLKLIDIDQSYKYSDIKYVDFSGNSEGRIKVKPNPANELITLQFSSINQGDATVEIKDASGRTVINEITFSIEQKEFKEVHIPVNQLAPGVYLIVLTQNDTRKFEKLVIER